MKNFLLGVIMAGTYSVSAQSVVFTNVTNPSAAVNGDTLEYTSETTVSGPQLSLKNTGAARAYKWGRVIIEAPSAAYSDQLCDDEQCYSCSGNYWEVAGTFPSNGLLASGDSTVFQPKVIFQGGGGSAHVRYYALTTTGVKIDSVDVKFTSTVGLVEKNQTHYAVYPNPANNILNIEISDANNASLIIYDITGKNVVNKNLVNGKNILNIENLRAGVYFYSVLVNGESIETKKLLVK